MCIGGYYERQILCNGACVCNGDFLLISAHQFVAGTLQLYHRLPFQAVCITKHNQSLLFF